jgi:hypothetical protein
MYLFNVGIGDDTEYIMLEYNGNQEFEKGKYYNVFADVKDTYENYARLVARFIYEIDKEDLPTATPTPEATPAPTPKPEE